MKLAYSAVDKSGKVTTDTIEAEDSREASEQLRQRGLYVTSIDEASSADTVRSESRGGGAGGARLKDVSLWARQLSVLVRSGTPLTQALVAIENQVRPGPWKEIIEDVRTHVEEGASLSEAMSRHDNTFDDVCRSLVAAGESSGQLGEMLDRLSILVRQQLKIKRALVGAMVYPALLMMVGLTVTLVMLLMVLPRFADLFDTLAASLPPTTKFLMGISTILRTKWWMILLSMAAVGIAGRFFVRSDKGELVVHKGLVRAPVLGAMVRNLCTARIARLLGVMLESRVPLLDALSLTQHATGNRVYVEVIGNAIEAANRGEAVSGVFARTPFIHPSVSEAMRHGEKNAQIGPIMTDMADFLDEENEVTVRTVMSLLEPLILIALGVVVGFIALSLFIPLFDLTAITGAKS